MSLAVFASAAMNLALAGSQPATSHRAPVTIEELGGLEPMTEADLRWTDHYPVSVRPLLRRWMQFNTECRGGPGGRVSEQNLQEWMTRVCSMRDAVANELRFHGYCYGRRGEAGSENEWHICTSISFGNDYFSE